MPVEQQDNQHAHQGQHDWQEQGKNQIPDPGAVGTDSTLGYNLLKYIHRALL